MTEKYKTNNLELNTKKKLFNKAVSYLAKFETTTGKLKLILEKFASNNLPGVSHKIISHQISEVVTKCEKLNYVSDENFLENKIVYFLKKGLSLKVIENRLREFQIDAEKYKKVLHSFYEDDKNLELKSAIYLAKKNVLDLIVTKKIIKKTLNSFKVGWEYFHAQVLIMIFLKEFCHLKTLKILKTSYQILKNRMFRVL